MKYYSELLKDVQNFVDTNLAKKFVIKRGCFEGETVTIAGYTERDGLGIPSVIVELPNISPMGDLGWGIESKHDLYDRIILDADPMKGYWYVDIEDLEEC